MRTILLLVVVLCLVATVAASADVPVNATAKDMQWWRDAKFGMFIHWGPSSLTGGEISFARYAKRPGVSPPYDDPKYWASVPVDVYDNLYKQFAPVKFDADAWMKLAKAAGMKYVVFTTKHCDGFCNWDTKLQPYNIMNSPFKRDICAELAKAAHANGIKLGWYYSCLDWYHPDFLTDNHAKYIEYMHEQVKELLTNYGKVSIMWFDVGNPPERYDAVNLAKMVHKLQPGIIINDRLGAGDDYSTPEQTLGGFNDKRPWETCMTMGTQWSYSPNMVWKSSEECINALVNCACGDGNLLLNISPSPTGEINEAQTTRLRQIGAWIKKYGKTIYGTRGGPFILPSMGGSTRKGNRIYVHILKWPSNSVTLSQNTRKIISVKRLAGSVTWKQDKNALTLMKGPGECSEPDTIVQLTLDGPASDIKPFRAYKVALSTEKPAKASNIYCNDPHFGPGKAVDDYDNTHWQCDASVTSAWMEVDLEQPTTFDHIYIDENGGLVSQFELQCRDKETDDWRTFYKGTTVGSGFNAEIKPITARYVRLNVLKTNEGLFINEFQLHRIGR